MGWTLGALIGAVSWLFASPAPRIRAAPARCAEPSLVVLKAAGTVELWCSGTLRERHLATFGAEPRGTKLRRGDERTPEGVYHISSRLVVPRFHRFLGIDYPNAADRARARALGITDLGGGIGIHGVEAKKADLARVWLRLGNTLGLLSLWGPTDGCIGVTNEAVESLYEAVQVGAPIRIRP